MVSNSNLCCYTFLNTYIIDELNMYLIDLLDVADLILSSESAVGDDDYDTYSTKKRRLSGKILKGALHVMKENIKTIVITMKDGEAREDARHHETMDRENTHHIKALELEHRRITSSEETSRGYIKTLKSIGDGLRSISQSF